MSPQKDSRTPTEMPWILQDFCPRFSQVNSKRNILSNIHHAPVRQQLQDAVDGFLVMIS
jgi:hypothetical protein